MVFRFPMKESKVIFLMAAPSLEAARYRACASRLEAARYRACASRRACIRSAHFLDGCALSRLHSLRSCMKPKKRQDMKVDRLDRPVGVNQLNPLVLRSQLKITLSDPRVEIQVFLLETPLILDPRMISCACSRQAERGIDIEENRYFGSKMIAYQVCELVNKVQGEAASETLICHGCMIKAVANHHLVTFQRGL